MGWRFHGNHCRRTITAGRESHSVKSEIDQGRHFDGEILNYRNDGTPFWNALLITAIHDDVGEHVGFSWNPARHFRQKNAEFALRQSEAHLRSILDLEPDCVKILSPDGRLMVASAGFMIVVSLSVMTLERRSVWMVSSPTLQIFGNDRRRRLTNELYLKS